MNLKTANIALYSNQTLKLIKLRRYVSSIDNRRINVREQMYIIGNSASQQAKIRTLFLNKIQNNTNRGDAVSVGFHE